MEMVVPMPLLPTVQTKGKILLAVIGHDPVHQTVLVQSVQGPVNGGPVHLLSQLQLQTFMAQRFPALFQGI
tara:strand:- start:2928 stop:3140 length:213 start_codon:yes stop_codon:yes gene_type:complete